MTIYTSITGGEIDADSPITESLVTRLRDNPIAISEGSTGAPKIQTSAYDTGSVDEASIGAGAVHQSELNTGLHSISVPGSDYVVLNGGQYGFYPQVGGHPTIETEMQISTEIIGTGYHTVIANQGVTAFNAQQRYINASAPYDLGDGETPFFAFVLFDSSGNFVSASASETPPWIYNGPTNVQGKQYRRSNGSFFYGRYERPSALQAKKEGKNVAELISSGRLTARELLEEKPVFVEITPQDKNADMGLIASPFEKRDRSVVLLDPMSSIMQELRLLHDTGEDVLNIIENYLVIDNKSNGRNSSPGVMPVDFRFKNTGAK
jgi:hypothetical protein